LIYNNGIGYPFAMQRYFAAIILFLIPVSIYPLDQLPGREVSFPPEVIEDVFFSYVVGVVFHNSTGRIDGEFLIRNFPEFKDDPNMPFNQIVEVARISDGENENSIIVKFRQEGKIPIPLSIVGGYPGYIGVPKVMNLRESRITDRKVGLNAKHEAILSPVYEYTFQEGHLYLDVSDIIDFILGGFLDDMYIETIAVFRYEGVWYGMTAGRGYKGQVITGIFDFQNTRLVFPVPKHFRKLGSYFLE
jgi:hypothetical protein